MRTFFYIILTYAIYAIIKSIWGIGGLLGGGIAGGIVGFISWFIDKKIRKSKDKDNRTKGAPLETEKDNKGENVGLLKRICLGIPFVRHKMTMNSISEFDKERDLVNVVNRYFSRMAAPNIVKLYNEGKVDMSAINSPAYHKYMIVKMFGKKAKQIAEQIKVEKATLKSLPNDLVYFIILPSHNDIGQNYVVAFVVNSKNKAYCYSWEWSVNQTRMICTWENKNHLNYGLCDDKVEFLKRIISLSEEIICEENNYDVHKFDELDLKHRLAKEIGVRYEKLDFYMKTFQKMVYDGMSGIDTSGMPDGIDDIEEWQRYCNWEINQAKQRMSSEELEQSKMLFNMMVDKHSYGTDGHD